MAETEPLGELVSRQRDDAPATPTYFINFDGYAAKKRSRDAFLRDRMCMESRTQMGSLASPQAQVEEAPSGRGRVRFATRRGRAGGDPVTIIQECCSRKPEYRDPHLPLKEVLFRILLAEGNRPMTAEELRVAASEWTGYEYGGVINAEAVQQLMENDEYYGFKSGPSK